MIHPAGLGGRPVDGQRRTAAAKASWTASSATSMSPKTRISTATARPYSSVKTRSISAVRTSDTVGLVFAMHRPHLDRQGERSGDLARPAERGVEVGHPDDRESAEVLLALDVRPVGHEQVAVAHAHDRGGARRVQTCGEHPRPRLLHLPVHRLQLAHDRLEHLGRRWVTVGLVDAEQVLRHGWLLSSWSSTLCTNGGAPDRQWHSYARILPSGQLMR